MYIVVLLSLICLMFWLYSYNTYWKKKNVTSIKQSSLINSFKILCLRLSIWNWVEELYRKCDEKYMGFFMLNKPCLFVKDLNLIKHILVKDFNYFPDRTLGRNTHADKIGARILFTLPFDEWKFIRTKTVSAYTTNRINSQIPLMIVVCNSMVEFLEKHQNQPVNIKEIAAYYSTDIITTSAYGIDGKCFTEEKDNYRTISEKLFPPTFSRAIQFAILYVAPFLTNIVGATFLDRAGGKTLETTYKDQIKTRMETKTSRNCFLDFLIDVSERETDPRCNIYHSAMISQATQYFMAGFETVGSTFSYALYELAKYPDLQTRLREEIESAKGNETLTAAAIKDMPYLDMVIRETLRMYPILPFLDRKVVKDYKVPDSDLVLEKGTNVYLSVSGMHFDPKYYPDPYTFDPERFSPQNKHKIDPFTYMPFGGGPRICIGARFGVTAIKTGIAYILSNFIVSTCPDTCPQINYLPATFLLIPEKDIQLVFKKI